MPERPRSGIRWRENNMNPQDASKTKAPFERIGRKLDEEFGEAAQKMEREGERVIAYLNNEVVPAIRNHSSKALRTAAEQLSRLAEYMDKNRSK
jgi:hypothetical protein